MKSPPESTTPPHLSADALMSAASSHSSASTSPLSPTARPPVFRIAITGGPCAGKTTALAEVGERLRTRGFGVFTVPEAATLLFTGGVSPAHNNAVQTQIMQTELLRTQTVLEDSFLAVARSRNQPAFVLCDRGTCDGRAYMPDDMWRAMLRENRWDMVSIRDARYDLVVHLVTAADGADRFYTLENNQARSETPAEARRVDARTQAAWVGHPQLRIVDNRSGFREKIDRVFAHIVSLAGETEESSAPVGRVMRKFLLRCPGVGVGAGAGGSNGVHKGMFVPGMNGVSGMGVGTGDAAFAAAQQMPSFPSPPPPPLPPGGEEFAVEQTFLSTGLGHGVQESVRRRGKDGGTFTFVHKVRRGAAETKRQITNREYLSLLAHADGERRTVRLRRQCFLHSGTYFVLDCVSNVGGGVWLLRCHCESHEERVPIPSWLSVDCEVTGHREFTMHSMSCRVLPERVRGDENPIQREDHIGLDVTDMARSF